MKKKIILAILFIALLVGAFILSKNKAPVEVVEDGKQVDETGKENPEVVQNTPTSQSDFVDPKTEAWILFQKYLTYNKENNLDGVKSTVYKISTMCNTPKPSDECNSRMSSAYLYGADLKKVDFINVWSDSKQIIISTDFWVEDSDDMNLIGKFKTMIFFVRDEGGNLRLLSFNPSKGGATGKGTASSEELNERIDRWTEDLDMDGVADYEEECLHKPNDATCTKTNPKERDTDSDGWWDGTEAIMAALK